jgi:hypothetical protein
MPFTGHPSSPSSSSVPHQGVSSAWAKEEVIPRRRLLTGRFIRVSRPSERSERARELLGGKPLRGSETERKTRESVGVACRVDEASHAAGTTRGSPRTLLFKNRSVRSFLEGKATLPQRDSSPGGHNAIHLGDNKKPPPSHLPTTYSPNNR